MHVLIMGDTDEQVERASGLVNELVFNPGAVSFICISSLNSALCETAEKRNEAAAAG